MNCPYANYHTHTARCNHATGTEREYIETAVKNGMKVLGFSDHSPYIFNKPGMQYSYHRMRPELTDDYIKVLTDLKAEYKNDIEIHIGFEIEYYNDCFYDTMKFLSDYPLEYLICGMHFIGSEQKDDHVWSYSEGLHGEETIREFAEETIEALHTGVFTYLAHPDLINYPDDCPEYEKYMEEICLCAKKLNIPLEFNLLGFATGRSYPRKKFFEIAKRVGNDVIIGCDAHEPSGIAYPGVYERAVDLLSEIGIQPLKEVELVPPFCNI